MYSKIGKGKVSDLLTTFFYGAQVWNTPRKRFTTYLFCIAMLRNREEIFLLTFMALFYSGIVGQNAGATQLSKSRH